MLTQAERADAFAIVRGPFRIVPDAWSNTGAVFGVFRDAEHLADLSMPEARTLARCDQLPAGQGEWAADPEFLDALWATMDRCPPAKWSGYETLKAKLRHRLHQIGRSTKDLVDVIEHSEEQEADLWQNFHFEAGLLDDRERDLLPFLEATAAQLEEWAETLGDQAAGALAMVEDPVN